MIALKILLILAGAAAVYYAFMSVATTITGSIIGVVMALIFIIEIGPTDEAQEAFNEYVDGKEFERISIGFTIALNAAAVVLMLGQAYLIWTV